MKLTAQAPTYVPGVLWFTGVLLLWALCSGVFILLVMAPLGAQFCVRFDVVRWPSTLKDAATTSGPIAKPPLKSSMTRPLRSRVTSLSAGWRVQRLLVSLRPLLDRISLC